MVSSIKPKYYYIQSKVSDPPRPVKANKNKLNMLCRRKHPQQYFGPRRTNVTTLDMGVAKLNNEWDF